MQIGSVSGGSGNNNKTYDDCSILWVQIQIGPTQGSIRLMRSIHSQRTDLTLRVKKVIASLAAS